MVCGFLAALGMMMPPTESYSEMRPPQVDNAAQGAVRRISMGIGKSVIVDLPEDASEIFVGNPKVANAVVRSARKLYIIGMADGQTTVFALDAKGRQIAALEISIGRDVGELQQILNAALPNSTIITRTINDTIILSGTVDSPEEAQRATDIAEGFVKQTGQAGPAGGQSLVVNSLIIRGRDQVMLKVSVAEIRRDVAKQLGLTSSTWGSFTQYNPFGISGVIAANPSTGLPSQLTIHNPANTVNATLQAFERYGVSRILAEPTVTAISGESAKFTVGGQVPIPERAGLHDQRLGHQLQPRRRDLSALWRHFEFCTYGVVGRPNLAAHRDRSHRARLSDRRDDSRRHRPRPAHAQERDDGGIAVGRLDRIGRISPNKDATSHQRSARGDESADSRSAVPLPRLSTQRDRADDHRHALSHEGDRGEQAAEAG